MESTQGRQYDFCNFQTQAEPAQAAAVANKEPAARPLIGTKQSGINGGGVPVPQTRENCWLDSPTLPAPRLWRGRRPALPLPGEWQRSADSASTASLPARLNSALPGE